MTDAVLGHKTKRALANADCKPTLNMFLQIGTLYRRAPESRERANTTSVRVMDFTVRVGGSDEHIGELCRTVCGMTSRNTKLTNIKTIPS